MAGKAAAPGTAVLLVTANVGSLFDDVSALAAPAPALSPGPGDPDLSLGIQTQSPGTRTLSPGTRALNPAGTTLRPRTADPSAPSSAWNPESWSPRPASKLHRRSPSP